MPILSMFYGIIIRMYNEKNGNHNLPHIHAEYQGETIIISLEGDVIEGDMQKKLKLLVLAWMEIHRDELIADWQIISDGGEYFKIDPLR